jgi:polyhydroxybutyrate depolymerase
VKLVRLLVATALAVASLALAPARPTSAAGCTLAATAGTITRSVGGRTYTINVPAGLTATQVPLVLALHGAGSTSSTMESFSGLTPFAAQRGFIVAYPQGSPAGAGYWSPGPGSADVTFLRQVVTDISSTWCVDPHHVHATGWSRGAVMSLRLACDAADVFASVTSYAGSDPTLIDGGGPCSPSRAIGIGIFSGAFDFISVVPINQHARDQWRTRNGCPASPQTEQVVFAAETYGPCNGGVYVVYRLYAQSHNWPVGADATDILNRMWALYQANPLP